MTVSAGTRLGPYEIVAVLGAGGMGEVYRARDTRIGREVAIKVLPESLAGNSERLRRFEQEARVVGALNHPNILAVYDVGTQNGLHYLVSELLQGESLRDRIAERPFSGRRVKEYALQIARGLAAAHAKGIVHRDLKPENIFVTREELVKILDFGLAKQEQALITDATASVSKTVPGLVMGTVGYMSPEQVRGEAVDHRTDIFSFGAVLYEMMSGKRAFQGPSSVETMSAILKDDPPELESSTSIVVTSPGLERVMRRCLEKAPERRFQSASDLAFAIEAMSEVSGATVALNATKSASRTWLAALVVIALAAVAGVWAGRTLMQRPQPTYRQLVAGPGYVSTARFAPDGQNVIYGAAWNGKPLETFVVGVDGKGSRSLGLPSADVLGIAANGDMALSLGRHVRFQWITSGTLARAPVSGGAARPLLDDICDADINADGKEFAIVRCAHSEQTLEYPVGHVLLRTSGYIDRVRIEPGGNHIAFAEHPITGDDRGFISVIDGSGKLTRLTPEWEAVKGLTWAPGNEIWFSAASAASDQPDSIWAVNTAGKLRRVLTTPTFTWVQDVSPTGKVLLLNAGHANSNVAVHWPGAANDEVLDLAGAIPGGLSADGKLLVFTDSSTGSDYLTELMRPGMHIPIRLGEGMACGISPDGKWVLSSLPSAPSKFVLYPTGTGDTRHFDLAPVSNIGIYCSWSADGKYVAFTGSEPGKGPRAYLIDVQQGSVRSLSPEGTDGAILSPDGTLVIVKQQDAYIAYPVSGGEARPVPGLAVDERPIGWDESNRKLFVWNGRFPANIALADIESGKREAWGVLTPPDTSGLLWGSMAIAPNGKAYAYRFHRLLTSLVVADGLR